MLLGEGSSVLTTFKCLSSALNLPFRNKSSTDQLQAATTEGILECILPLIGEGKTLLLPKNDDL